MAVVLFTRSTSASAVVTGVVEGLEVTDGRLTDAPLCILGEASGVEQKSKEE